MPKLYKFFNRISCLIYQPLLISLGITPNRSFALSNHSIREFIFYFHDRMGSRVLLYVLSVKEIIKSGVQSSFQYYGEASQFRHGSKISHVVTVFRFENWGDISNCHDLMNNTCIKGLIICDPPRRK